MSKKYEVFVSNLGRVYHGPDVDDANAEFEDYVEASKSTCGRASGESVILIRDGDPVREYSPELEASRAVDKVETLTGLYDYIMGATESFEEDDIGADCTYLVGAVLKGGKCAWPESRPFVRLLRAMPEERLRVTLLRHVEIEPEDE